MNAEQWRRVEQLLPAALELGAHAREAFLDAACAGDSALRSELDALIAAHEQSGLLDRPLTRPAAAFATDPGPAAGTIVGHYEVLERLGSGGMGVVHRARDRRLDRTVALKFLPRSLCTDAAAKRRFLIEARAAAALDHPNVCTVHEIGETEDGQLFIAMALVRGEPLRDIIEREALPVSRAVWIARQIAAALASAHAHGVIHRDVKPANVMVSDDGVVKLVDFGIARLPGSTETASGSRAGTIAYMSPEQIRGDAVDFRTDLWSLGVVLYEMLSGERPFPADSDVELLHGIVERQARPLRELRPRVPAALEQVVSRAMTKDPGRRFASAEAMDAALAAAMAEGDASASPRAEEPGRRRAAALLPLAAILITAGAIAAIPAWRAYSRGRAIASLERIEQLSREGSYLEAYSLAVRAERALPGDARLEGLMTEVADHLTVVSKPAGARVWIRPVAEDGTLARDSTFLGVSPLYDARIARADYRVFIARDGFMPAERIASSALNRAEASFGVPLGVTIEVTLLEEGAARSGMVHVPGSSYTLVGREAPTAATVELDDFFIDRHEVTNGQYREFVVAGGYADLRQWRTTFTDEGRDLAPREAASRMVDRTGLPGPREWSGQQFPPGSADQPVTGITWYEADAFCAHAGKRLPTIFEWEKAARDGRYTHFEQVVMPWGLTDPNRGIAGRANFAGSGVAPVGSHPAGVSPYGAHDMAGNVEEWIANSSGARRFITGGAWDDPMYVFANYLSVSPFYASSSLGFRCAADAQGSHGDQGALDIPPGEASNDYEPVDDATFRTLLDHYAYDRRPLNPTVLERVTTDDWTRETVAIAGPWSDPTRLYLYLPARGEPPFQTIAFIPGTNTFMEAALADETERIMGAHVKAGRAVIAVLFKGMRGRPWDVDRVPPATSSVQYRQELVLHSTELRRAIDYAVTRADLDIERLAYVGLSKGSGTWLPFAAVEPRFRSVVLIGGGIDERMQPVLPEVNSVNFAPRIRAPTLMLNGRYDEEHPWERRALPLWRLLPEPKRLELVEAGHVPHAEARIPIINAWLDETLGAVR